MLTDESILEGIKQLTGASSVSERLSLVRERPELRTVALVERMYDEVVVAVRTDLSYAARLADVACWLAAEIDDPSARALSLRASGHVLHLTGKHEAAVERYEAALQMYEELGRDLEAARTINGAMQAMIYLGRYDQAFARADRAREIFREHGDRLRLARLDTNVANLLYRQDRFSEAITLYRHAYAEFLGCGEAQDIAVVLRNMAVCQITLHEFEEALETYTKAREYCERHGLRLLVVKADYNIAYLYYLRGQYAEAIQLYDRARVLSEQVGDAYHRALCDLDQAEMYLELNLSEAGADMAKRAHAGFTALAMNYEAAKALAFLAIAESHLGRTQRALTLFDTVRQLFERECNHLWPALVDLYKALVLFEQAEYSHCRQLCECSLAAFTQAGLSSKAAICELMLARLDLQDGDSGAAARRCAAALRQVRSIDAPALALQAWIVVGRVRESQGDMDAAYRAFQRARLELENLRGHLPGEELKIAFLKDKLEAYESLVSLAVLRGTPAEAEKAFGYIEQAKSRSLADLIAFRASALRPKDPASAAATQLQGLREKLNAAYRQIRSDELNAGSPQRLQMLRRQARDVQHQLVRTLAQMEAEDREFVGLQTGGTAGLAAVQAAIPAGCVVLEYYIAHGILYLCVLDRTSLEIIRLGPVAPLQEGFRYLQFQMSKFAFGAEYARTFADALLEATRSHLRELYDALIAPVRDRIRGRHLIIVPHSFLHYVPFHALWDGEAYLVDEFSISYAPSSSIFALCSEKTDATQPGALVLGVPDASAPHIVDEVECVASALAGVRLFVGAEATASVLRQFAPTSRFVHIATHGLFRRDNPMFSSLRLGQSELTLSDLYELEFHSELVTLSGCGTGLNAVVGGDELLGLVRGLLYAGARAALVTLWDVHDESTAAFMKTFYTHLPGAVHKAAAVRQTMLEIREAYPHPYYWAPFVLVGSVS